MMTNLSKFEVRYKSKSSEGPQQQQPLSVVSRCLEGYQPLPFVPFALIPFYLTPFRAESYTLCSAQAASWHGAYVLGSLSRFSSTSAESLSLCGMLPTRRELPERVLPDPTPTRSSTNSPRHVPTGRNAEISGGNYRTQPLGQRYVPRTRNNSRGANTDAHFNRAASRGGSALGRGVDKYTLDNTKSLSFFHNTPCINGRIGVTSIKGMRNGGAFSNRADFPNRPSDVLVIATQGNGHDSKDDVRDSREIARSRGYEWAHYPIHENNNMFTYLGEGPLSLDQGELNSLISLLKRILEVLRRGGTVMIHCRAGRHRAVGFFGICMRIFKGWTTQQVDNFFQNARPDAQFHHWWLGNGNDNCWPG